MIVVETNFTIYLSNGQSVNIRMSGKEGQYKTAQFAGYGIILFKTSGALAKIYTWNTISTVDFEV